MKLQSLDKDYKLFINIVVFGAIAISLFVLHVSYKSFKANSKLVIADVARKTNQQLTESLSYVNNISNLIGNQIISKDHIDKKNVAEILLNTNIKSGSEIQDIFTWTLFDFIDQNDYVVASSSQGILKEPVLVTANARSWILEAKNTPWKLLAAKPSVGIISKEPIIPFGFGISKKDGTFVGTISFGINVNKLKRKLKLASYNSYTTFALIDEKNEVIISSENFDFKKAAPILENLKQDKYEQGPIDEEESHFFYKFNDYCQFKILIGIDRKTFLSQLRSSFIPKALNTIYLTIFFLILLYFFRAKLLNPVLKLSEVAEDISQGKLETTVPRSGIAEVNSLCAAIEKVKRFLVAEELVKQNLRKGKDNAEIANYNKTEFLSSTAHELKNMLSGITGLGELLKMNLTGPSESISEMKKREAENINWIIDIIKLSEESVIFVNDILDVNQAQTGDFKIEVVDVVDLKDITFRSINLMRVRALKEKKHLTTNIDDSKKFITYKLDPRRVKQIIVNILSNAIKHSPRNSEIKVSMTILSEEESIKINSIIEKNIKNNHDFTNAKINRLLSLFKAKIENNNKRIAVEIEDHGYGMDEEELKIAAQKYGKIQHDPSQKIDSTGLGLPIVQHLIEEQCGLLEIKSLKDKGTKVRIIF